MLITIMGSGVQFMKIVIAVLIDPKYARVSAKSDKMNFANFFNGTDLYLADYRTREVT